MQNLIQRLLCSPAAVFLCFFGLIAGLKWSVLSLPPV